MRHVFARLASYLEAEAEAVVEVGVEAPHHLHNAPCVAVIRDGCHGSRDYFEGLLLVFEAPISACRLRSYQSGRRVQLYLLVA